MTMGSKGTVTSMGCLVFQIWWSSFWDLTFKIVKKVKINNILECLSDCKKSSYVNCLMKLFSQQIFLGELTIKHLQNNRNNFSILYSNYLKF